VSTSARAPAPPSAAVSCASLSSLTVAAGTADGGRQARQPVIDVMKVLVAATAISGPQAARACRLRAHGRVVHVARVAVAAPLAWRSAGAASGRWVFARLRDVRAAALWAQPARPISEPEGDVDLDLAARQCSIQYFRSLAGIVEVPQRPCDGRSRASRSKAAPAGSPCGRPSIMLASVSPTTRPARNPPLHEMAVIALAD